MKISDLRRAVASKAVTISVGSEKIELGGLITEIAGTGARSEVGDVIIWLSTTPPPDDWIAYGIGGEFDAAVYPKLLERLGTNTLPDFSWTYFCYDDEKEIGSREEAVIPEHDHEVTVTVNYEGHTHQKTNQGMGIGFSENAGSFRTAESPANMMGDFAGNNRDKVRRTVVCAPGEMRIS